jgi:hypothetical protein
VHHFAFHVLYCHVLTVLASVLGLLIFCRAEKGFGRSHWETSSFPLRRFLVDRTGKHRVSLNSSGITRVVLMRLKADRRFKFCLCENQCILVISILVPHRQQCRVQANAHTRAHTQKHTTALTLASGYPIPSMSAVVEDLTRVSQSFISLRCVCMCQCCDSRAVNAAAVQVVRDAAALTKLCWQMRFSAERDAALISLHTLMNLAACNSLRDKLTKSNTPATGLHAVRSANLQHCMALSFAFAEAGATSVEFVELLTQLIARDLAATAEVPGAPFSVATATNVMQALAYSGSTSIEACSTRRLAAELCSGSLSPALSAFSQQYREELPVFTSWDWARFYVPKFGLFRGVDAALSAPAPLLHMHGLHVQLEDDRSMSQFALSSSIQRILPGSKACNKTHDWRVYASWGQRDPLDTLVLLLHSFLVAHLKQSRLSSDPCFLDAALFSSRYLPAFNDADKLFVQQVYAAIHALGKGQEGQEGHASMRTRFPAKLLLADSISRKVGIVVGSAISLEDCKPSRDVRKSRVSDWDQLPFQRSAINSLLRHHPRKVQVLMKALQRVSVDQPSLRERLFSSTHELPAVRDSPRLHANISALRNQLEEELLEGSNDSQVCEWLVFTLRQQPDDLNSELLQLAAMEDAVHMCCWLKKVPESVMKIRACYGQMEIIRHREVLHKAVRHLPDLASNEQVAQALHDAVMRSHGAELVALITCVRTFVMLAQLFDPINQLSRDTQRARGAVEELQRVRSMVAAVRHVHSDKASGSLQLQRIKERIRDKVPFSILQYYLMKGVLDRAMLGISDTAKYNSLLHKLTHERTPHDGSGERRGSGSSAAAPPGWTFLQDVGELLSKAGSGKAVQHCRVTAELAKQSSHSVAPCDQGLPTKLQQNCHSMLSKVHGAPSEMQVCTLHRNL